MLKRGQPRIFALFVISILFFGYIFVTQGNLEFVAYQVNIIIYALIICIPR